MVTQNTTTAGAASAARHIQLTEPQANQQIVIDNIAGAALDMGFPSEAAQLEQSGQDLVFLFENGGRIVLSNFFGLFESNQLPAFNLEDGQTLPGDAFLAALREDLLPAAGPGAGAAAGSGGVGDYDDNAGDLIGGVGRLDPLGTGTFGVTPLATIEDDATPLLDTVPTLVLTIGAFTLFESNLGDGSSSYRGETEGPITFSGSFAITAPDGIGSLTVGSSVFSAAQLAALAGGTPLVVNLGAQDAYADMVLTGFDGTNVFFTYILTEDSTHTFPTGEDRTENIPITITDSDGDSASGTIVVTISDDEPYIGKVGSEEGHDDYPWLHANGKVIPLHESPHEHGHGNGNERGGDGEYSRIADFGMGSQYGHDHFWTKFDLTSHQAEYRLDNGVIADLRVNGGTPFFSRNGLGVTYDGDRVPGDSPDRENELGYRDDKVFHEQESVVFKLNGVADAFTLKTGAFYGDEGRHGELGKVLFFLGDDLVASKTLEASDRGDSFSFTKLPFFDRVVVIGLDYQDNYYSRGGDHHQQPGDSSDFYITDVGFHMVSEIGVGHGDLDFTYGADDMGTFALAWAGFAPETPEVGPEPVAFVAQDESTAQPSGIWTLDGQQVEVVSGDDGRIVGYIAGESSGGEALMSESVSNIAFILQVDPVTGYWTFTQKVPLDLPDSAHGKLTFNYTITDGDGDTASSSFTVKIIEAERTPDIDMPTEAHVVHESGLFTPFAVGTEAGHEDVVATGTFVIDMQHEDFSAITMAGKHFANLDALRDGGLLFIGENGLAVDNPLHAHAALDVTGYTFDAATGKYTVSYTYVLYDNVNHTFPDGTETGDVIPISVTDVSGDSAYATLTITIVDDHPIAHDNVAWVAEDGGHDHNPFTDDEASGNVITGNIFWLPELGDDQQGADGAKVSDIKFGFHSEGVDSNGETINGLYGTLFIKADGSYTYTLNNGNDAVQHLIPGETLKEVFTYTLKDGDGDTDTAKLTITINGANDRVEIGCINSLQVNEDDLPWGSDIHKESLTDYGQFIVTANDGLNVVKINGESVIINGDIQSDHTIDTPYGNLVVYDVDYLGDGKYRIEYKFTLDDNAHHANGNGENDYLLSLGLAVSDRNGDWDTASINVHITDDVPTAHDNYATVTEDGNSDWNPHTGQSDSGNVVTGNFFWNEPGDDVQGADGANVSKIQFDASSVNVDANGETINGLYGTLFVKADGTYTYTLNNSSAAVQHLTTGETLQEVFTYTLKDGDGDTDTAKLTITIDGADDKVSLTGLCGSEGTVYESGLADGSAPSALTRSFVGDFFVDAKDGLDEIRIEGVKVIDNGALTGSSFTNAYGTLVVTAFDAATGKVSYTYTLTDNIAHGSSGSTDDALYRDFTVTAVDRDGDSDSATLTVKIVDDNPNAHDNTASVTEDSGAGQQATGNLITDSPTDTQGADGAKISFVQGDNSRNIDADGETINGQYGTLFVKADGTYTYTLNNASAAVQTLTTGEKLYDTFTYTLKDGDTDTDTAKLKITINGADDGVTITNLTPSAQGGEFTVYENDLANGSSPNNGALTKTGAFNVSAPDGLDEVWVGGVKVVDNGSLYGNTSQRTIDTAYGNVVVTGFNATTGEVSYKFTLDDNAPHTASGTDPYFLNLTVTAKDTDGDAATPGTLSIQIVDDVPDAKDNTGSVTEDISLTATGNLITNSPGDVKGADGASISHIAGSTSSNVDADGETINGQYGTLTVKADGTYTYNLNNGNADVQGLTTGEKLHDVFTYTLKDGDGDIDTATLDITINGKNDGVTITNLTPSSQGGEFTVYENDLANGSSPDSGALTKTGTFTVSAPDGLDEVLVGGVKVIDNGVLAANVADRTIDTANGNLVITSFNAATGEVGYSFTLDAAATHTMAGVDDTFVHLAVQVTDTDTDVANSFLSIRIVDDVPDAKDNANSVTEDSGAGEIASGNLINDATADVKGADGASISHIAGSTSANVDTDGETINGLYGTLFVKADGTYSYTLDNSNGTVQALNTGQSLHDIFTYTLKDGDGDIDTANLDITINGRTEDYVLNLSGLENPEGTVHEAGLPGGSGVDGVGLGMTGAFTITATAGLDEVSIGGTTVIDGGVVVNGGTVDTLNGLLVVDSVVPGAGGTYTVNYHFTLDDNATHPAGGTLSLPVEVSDNYTAGTPNATGTLNINITDDHPTAVNDVAEYAGGITTNLVIMIDRSGSMDDPSGIPGQDKWDVALAGMQELIDAYAHLGSVNVKIVDFYSGTANSSSWYYDANSGTVTYLDGKNPTGGTSYDAATNKLMADVANGMPPADKSVVYFLSDGDPDPDSAGLSGSEITNWENYLAGTPIDGVYAFGIGTNVGTAALGTVAWNADGSADHIVVVSNLNDFAQALLNTVPVTGNLLSNDDSGADGGKALYSITVDGVTHYIGEADASSHKLTLDLGEGKGSLTVDFDDGSYVFTPGVTPTGVEVIGYDIKDADGTHSNATLTLHLYGSDMIANDNFVSTAASGHATTVDTFSNGSTDSGWNGWSRASDSNGSIDRINVGGGDRELRIELDTNSGDIASGKSFAVAAGDTVSFDWRAVLTGTTNTTNHDKDYIQVEINDGTSTQTLYTVGNSTTSGTFSHTFQNAGTYTVTVRVVDGSGGNGGQTNNGLQAFIDDVTFVHAVAAAAIMGNVVTDASATEYVDQIGGHTALVTEVNGVALAQDGSFTDFNTDYGTLHINAYGEYTYTPKVGVDGHDDSFVYKLASTVAGDSSYDYATLNVHLGTAASAAPVSTVAHSMSGSEHFYQGDGNHNTINGTSGDDAIFGHGGNDVIHGNAGHDFLHGGAGNDTLYGDAGNDILVGGQGGDTLTGGIGADTFVWNAEDFTSGATDVVTDFKPGASGENDVLRFADVLLDHDGNSSNGISTSLIANGDLAQVGSSNDVQLTLHHGGGTQLVTLQGALEHNTLAEIEQHILTNKIVTENS